MTRDGPASRSPRSPSSGRISCCRIRSARRWSRGWASGRSSGLYSLVALVTFGWMIWVYRGIGGEPPLWAAGEALLDRRAAC